MSKYHCFISPGSVIAFHTFSTGALYTRSITNGSLFIVNCLLIYNDFNSKQLLAIRPLFLTCLTSSLLMHRFMLELACIGFQKVFKCIKFAGPEHTVLFNPV